MKKKCNVFLLKVLFAMLVDFVILNAICFFYYNLPAHYASATHSTNHKWESGKFYSRGTEGFASGVIDANGFNNLHTYKKGDIDLLVMGSSHMEAFNVAQDKNAVVLLNQKFKTDKLHMNAYNIGISGHTLEYCLANLDNALDEFAPQKYVVIETASVVPNAAILDQVINEKLPLNQSPDLGPLSYLQRIPYVRLLYAQLKNIIQNNKDTVPNKPSKATEVSKTDLYADLDEFMKKSVKKCQDTGVQIIIFYNCEIAIDEQGRVTDRTNLDDVTSFKEICDKNGVIFLDMYDAFVSEYKKSKKMPRGFSNTKVGEGHINETGHQVIADEIYAIINK